MGQLTRRALALCAAFTLLLGLLIFWRLDTAPGLNADEAWTGLRALEIQERGLLSPHGMNWYTAPLHAALVAKTFDLFGPGTGHLRLSGAVLNTAAGGIMALFIAANFGEAALLVFGGLLLVSPFYFLEARIAWEVCALQNFLAALMLWSSWKLFSAKRQSLIPLLVFVYAASLGALNHLIFMALPLGLTAGFAVKTLRGDDRTGNIAATGVWAVLCAASLLITKKYTSDTFWLAHRTAFSIIFISAPAAAAFLCWLCQDRFPDLMGKLSPAIRQKLGRAATVLIFIGMGAFIWFHATAFMGILSGFNMFKRFFSLDLGLAGAAPMFLWAAVLMGAVYAASVKAFKEEAGPEETFAACLLLGSIAAFTLLRNTNSARYYIIPFIIFAFAAAVFLPCFLRGLTRRKLLLLGLCSLLPPIFSIKELGWPSQRRPIHFTQGWHDETSARMQNVTGLAEKARAEKICIFAGDNFITFPLEFYYRAARWECVPTRTLKAEYCFNCANPPYTTSAIVPYK